jgi:hypothetical protein
MLWLILALLWAFEATAFSRAFFGVPVVSRTTELADGSMFAEAGSGSTVGLMERTRYIATNRFNVRPGKEAAFEKRWATRKSRLARLGLRPKLNSLSQNFLDYTVAQ